MFSVILIDIYNLIRYNITIKNRLLIHIERGNGKRCLLPVHIMTADEIIRAVVGPDQQGRCKTTIGFFVENWFSDGSENLLDEHYVQKPIVQISEFSDSENREYYCFDFIYKSKRDEDLKRQWRFLENFISKCLGNSEKTNPQTVLNVSIVPMEYNGKYSLFAKLGIPNSIVYTERAIDQACTIKIVFLKEDVCVWSHDEDLINQQQIVNEVTMELDAEEVIEDFGNPKDI